MTANEASASIDSRAFDVVRLVDDLIERAAARGASDIHFEPTAKGMLIRYRLDGVLSTVETLPASLADNIVTRLKVLAGLLTYRNDIPQEGRLQNSNGHEVIDRRLAIFPTIHGQRAIVRLFHEDPSLAELDRLGFEPSMLTDLKHIADTSSGVLLLTGPAGSGKSTTLAALLRYIIRHSPGKSIVSLEDPVERHIEGVTQVQITPQPSMDFPTALRSLLRQDPEVLMIGEIRDAQTARIVIEAGLTGHLLMSTLHSGTPGGALLRLLEMGIEPYQLTSSISAVVNQRLLRKLCPSCCRQDGSDAWQPAGCEACLQTGYRGRVLTAELLMMAPPLRQALLDKVDSETFSERLEAIGHETLYNATQRLIDRGITTRNELDRVASRHRS